MNPPIPYFPRCKQSDFAALISVGKILGIIREITDDNGQPVIIGINGCDWDLVFGDGVLFKNGQRINDENGNAYTHVNINTRFDLLERATAMSGQYPELADALAHPGKFFILDEQGKPRKPHHPQCTFGNYP